ncbi:hypothetical protein [Leclercia sp. UBA7405]|uniref:hypothetical protein n=1 Tax=Leclercia sp. UBA7405 TaxID=1946743 RepID=UPI003019C59E
MSHGASGNLAEVIPITSKLRNIPKDQVKQVYQPKRDLNDVKIIIEEESNQTDRSEVDLHHERHGIHGKSGQVVSNTGPLGKELLQVENEIMSVTREELDAKLDKNKAEFEAIAAKMQRDMAEWREHQNFQISQLNNSISALSAKIDGKLDSVDGDIKAINGNFSGLQGQMTGINTAISGIQSGISTRLAIFGTIIALIVAIPGVISSVNSFKPAQPTSSSQPIVIQVPQPPISSAPAQPPKSNHH